MTLAATATFRLTVHYHPHTEVFEPKRLEPSANAGIKLMREHLGFSRLSLVREMHTKAVEVREVVRNPV
jgi:hypothetical protein